MTNNYTCSLLAVTYTSCSSDNWPSSTESATACPHKMYGTFQYDGFEPFKFEVQFDPMFGLWISVQVNGRLKVLDESQQTRYQHIANAAMGIACANRGKTNPDDFNWTVTHSEITERS